MDEARQQPKGRKILAFPSDLEGRTIRVNPERAEAVEKLIAAFFSEAPQGIGRSQQLALALAARSKLLRDFLAQELLRQSKEHREGRLHALYEVFKEQIFHELAIKEFADAFAQMLAYGLFLAKLNAGEKATVTLDNVRTHIPQSFRLIRELVRFLEEMNEDEYEDVRWVVDEVLSIVNGLELDTLMADLSFRQRKAISRKVRAGDEEEHRLFERDPYIYFYEDYLKAYDKDMRKSRGVYYTPPPIVNFIVRAIDDILKDKFEIADGLADHKRVTVLDFACGTGTFLLEVFNQIFENIGGPQVGKADRVVREHMLKNLYGFEYLIAPYTIAHLKLSQFLKEKGHPLTDDERLQVFLTNTLEPIEPQANFMLPAITEEVRAAQAVKDKPILVITGNPPYSGHSKNKGAWITAAIDAYKKVDGKPLGEKNSKWLQDDYVKFIRFAQMKMDAVEEGVVGIITNHSWLDNPTFRGMRQSLMQSFEQIHVLDLHGSVKRKERTPEGGKDENVFDIEQGVAISLFVKRKGLERGVWRGDLWGKRLEKYLKASDDDFSSAVPQKLVILQPFYLFIAQNETLLESYQSYHSIPQIFRSYSIGSLTKRDELTVAFTREELAAKISTLSNASKTDAEVAHAFGVRLTDNDGWNLSDARAHVRSARFSEESFRPIYWRPFERRWIAYDDVLIARTNRRIMSTFDEPANLGLVTVRQLANLPFNHAFVTDAISDQHYLSTRTKEGGVVFPALVKSSENVSADFRLFLDQRYDHHYTPEEILGYIYAVLHAPIYRQRYAEFLRIDFPRVPFPETMAAFDALADLGSDLVDAHLLRRLPRPGLAKYHGKGGHAVDGLRYSPPEQAIWINKTQRFAPVPQNVWDFHIGGYQVLEKYLKSRKDRALSLDEIDHVSAVADSLAFTIDQMEKIDGAYRAAFGDRG
jgi:predicted helicase